MLLTLYFLFLKLGFLSFGGGYAMMSLIYSEASAAVGLTAAEFADLAALELLASGPIAINGATYVGYIKGGLLGAVAATAGVCTPPFILCAIIYYFLNKFKESTAMGSFLNAIKIACGGLLMSTALTIGRDIFLIENTVGGSVSGFIQSLNIWGIVLFICCAVGMGKFKIGPIKIIFAAGIFGVIFMR